MNWEAIYRERIEACADLPTVAQAWVPRAPRNVALLSGLARKREPTSDQLREIIECDPELTSQVLRQVNSCSAGLKVRIRTVKRAIGLLGERRCQLLVLNAMLQASLRLSSGDPAEMEAFVTECVERALFARFTAESLGLDGESAYVCALLEDLLLPALRSAFEHDYAAFNLTPLRTIEFERSTFGWTHEVVTAKVLKAWNLPDEVVAGVSLSHERNVLDPESPYHGTHVLPTVCASLLPDSFHQEPYGVTTLVQLQAVQPNFNLLAVAMQVDDELAALQLPGAARVPLCDRLARIAVDQVERLRQDIDWIGERIGNFVVESKIGQGGMGVVYLAQHAMLQRRAAIKLMKHRHLDAESLERFEVEARLTSGLRSPHTIEIYDYGTTRNGILYYVMEYLEGMSLGELVKRFGPQPQSRVVHILQQACDSLAEAHRLGLIHRDIKPENIFLSTGGWAPDFVKVLDFGLVKSATTTGEGNPRSPPVCGTPLFLSPEAILTPQKVDGRSDLYSLGLVAYYLLTGTPAIDGTDPRQVMMDQISTVPRRPSEMTTQPIEPDLEKLVMQCLEKLPEERPSSVHALAEALRGLDSIPRWTPDAAHKWWQENAAVLDAGWSDGESPASRTAVMMNSAARSMQLSSATMGVRSMAAASAEAHPISG